MFHPALTAAAYALLAPPAFADTTPERVENALSSGRLTPTIQAFEEAMRDKPGDDQMRFGLGFLRFARGVERLGQSLYEYGVKSENTDVPFLRLPVPENPAPNAIDYRTFRRILDDFHREMELAEGTLAGIKSDDVALPVRLAKVRFDLTGDGKPDGSLLEIMKGLMDRQNFDFLKENPEFLVRMDRGDVAWMRAYCHLLMAMADFMLAFDSEEYFERHAREAFAKPRLPEGTSPAEATVLGLEEPVRLERFRRHMISVCELNRETWKHIRAETDDDHEWLPNPKQKGVLGLPVRDEMIDAWLGMVGEVEGLLKGEKLLPDLLSSFIDRSPPQPGMRIDLRKILSDPPAAFDFNKIQTEGVSAKYWSKGPEVNIDAVLRVGSVFQNSTAVAYAAWFN